jgi:hypothetical protein
MVDKYWLMVDKYWLMVDKYWLMVDKYWLMVDKYWLMVDKLKFVSLILVHVCTLYTTLSCDQASQLP